jgi:2-polyprenyl-6-methoxyphenol hydroxylase-like FAD-dependent oxidoreductase
VQSALTLVSSQGYPIRMFDRTELMDLLYSQLPDGEHRVKTGRRVRRIGTAEMGIIVYFDDDTYEVGSIIIGADGFWSTVR